jgi:hypothetical protein
MRMLDAKSFNKKKSSSFMPLVASRHRITLEEFKCIISECEENDYSNLFKLQAVLFEFVKTVLKDWAFNKA